MPRPKGDATASPHYVNNKYFYEVVVIYQKTRDPKLLQILGSMFMKIAKKKLLVGDFANYDGLKKDDMLSEACLMCLRKIDKFDPDALISKSKDPKMIGLPSKNPFAYFSQVIQNAFRQYLKDHYAYINVIKNVDWIATLEENNEDGGFE